MRIKDLCKTYTIQNGQCVQALKNVSLVLPERGMVFVLGRSGSGKSTLLKVLAGLEKPTAGEIIYRGRTISSFTQKEADMFRNTYCGFIFQEYNLLPELTVGENVALPLEMQGEKHPAARVQAALAEVGLEGYEHRKISELSGGQRQRVAIARTLVKRPALIFADEPTGALDSQTGSDILSLLKELSKEHLVITVTHDREFAEQFGDRIIELADGELARDSAAGAAEEEAADFHASPTRLPVRAAVKVGGSNFRYHPFRLAVTFLLCLLSFFLFALSASFVLTDRTTAMIDSLYRSGAEEVFLVKQGTAAITEEELADYGAELGITLRGSIAAEPTIDEFADVTFPAYYAETPKRMCFLQEGDFESDLLGEFADAQDEVMLSRYTAEQLLFVRQETELSALLGTQLIIEEIPYTVTAVIDTHFDGSRFETLKMEEDRDLQNIMSRLLYDSSHTMLYFSHDAFAGAVEYSEMVGFVAGSSRRAFSELYHAVKERGLAINANVLSAVSSSLGLIDGPQSFFIALCIVCGVFSSALIVYFISQSIEDKATTIAVLKTMGAGKRTIWKIFLWEGVLFGLALFVLSAIACAIAMACVNASFAAQYGVLLLVYRFKAIDALLLFGVTSLCTLIGAAFPMKKIERTNPLRFLD